MSRLASILLVALCLSAAAVAEQIDIGLHVAVDDTGVDISHPQRVSSRQEDPLDNELSDRASLLFRAMDADRDRLISEQDVRASDIHLQTHMPGVSAEEFLSFMQTADSNRDGKLNREELVQGLADGLAGYQQQQQPSLMETDAATSNTGRRGIIHAVGKGIKKLFGVGKSALRRAEGQVDTSEDSCVMCQYIVERSESNVKQSGVIPSMSQATAFDSYLEVGSTASEDDEQEEEGSETIAAQELTEDDAMSLLELENGVASGQFYFDQTAAGIIGSTRQSTRVQRQLERQKYNEIYRVVDITLDDVCEQGMPNAFYGYCKQVYKVQSDIVDGLRYQYRPADICFRVGMCGKGSYITKGVHSRYK